MAVVPGEFVITQRCLATVAEQLGLTLPTTVAREPVFYEDGEWERERESAHAELAQIGLLDHGEPSPALVESLRVLCRSTVEFFGHVAAGDRRYSLHLAALGQEGVFAALANGEVVLRPAHPHSLVSALLAEIPQAEPAGGRSMSVPEAQLAPPSTAGQGTLGAARGDARRILEILNKPRQAGGRFQSAARIGIDNRRTVYPDPVDFIDVEDGRWLTYTTGSGNGTRYVTAAPGRSETIAGKLEETQQALRSAR